MRVLIAGGGTGGHLMPALALAEELRARRPDVEPVLVGAARGIEVDVLPTRSFRYHLLAAEPLYRREWWRNARWPLVVWRLARQCHAVLVTERPVLAVGTGGYAAGPILLASRWRGTPIALLEENARPGLTTRWLARRARQVHLGFPEARRFLSPGPGTEVFAHGNPVSPPPPEGPDRGAARRRLGVPEGARVVLVVGGSQGAAAINGAVAAAIDGGGFEDLVLLWSTGRAHWERHRGYDRPPHRQLRPFWDPIGEAYAAADLVIARAGAMTLAEICAFGLPSVLVPLPTAAGDHQTSNARALVEAGAAQLLPERDLTPDAIVERLRTLFATPGILDRMKAEALRRGRPDAVGAIVSSLLTLVG